MAYYPEGTYPIHREMFEVESVGTSPYINWTVIAGVNHSIAQNLAYLSDVARKYFIFPGIGTSQVRHNGRYAAVVKDFRTQIINIGGIFEDVDPPDINDIYNLYIRNALGNTMFIVQIYGDGHVEISNTVTSAATAAGFISLDDLFEIKVEISEINDFVRGNGAIRVYINGIDIRHDGAGVAGAWDNAIYTNTWARTVDSKPDFYEVIALNTNDIIQVNTWNYWQLYADMTNYGTIIPFHEVLILANDLCTFVPIGNQSEAFRINEIMNNITEAQVTVRSLDVFGAVANKIFDTRLDNEPDHFHLETEVRIFTQVSRIVAEGDAGTIPINNQLEDLNYDFLAGGVTAGDWIYTWNADGNHDMPRQITVVAQHRVTIGAGMEWTAGAPAGGYGNWTIVRGHERYHARYLGDHIPFKLIEYEPVMEVSSALLNMFLMDYAFHTTKYMIPCTNTKYYSKDFDRIFMGWPTESLLVGFGEANPLPSPPNYYIGGFNFGPQLGLMNPSIFTPLYDTNLTELSGLYSFVFRRNEFLFDALKKVVTDGAIQWVSFYDRYNEDRNYILFRDVKDKAAGHTTNIYGANRANISISEDDKIALGPGFRKGIRDKIDYVHVDGSRNGIDTGDLIASAYPRTAMPDRNTRQMFETDEYIWVQQQADIRAKAIYDDLSRIVPDGQFRTEYFPPRDSWAVAPSVTWADDGLEEYPGGAIISHITNQARPTNGSSSSASPGAHRHSQGDEYRKPFSRIGETGTIFLDAAWEEDMVVTQLTTEFGPKGFFSVVRPELRPWALTVDMADSRRDIDRVAQNFIDPNVTECPLIVLPDELTNVEDYIGVSMTNVGLLTGVDINPGTQIWFASFPPDIFVDEDNSDTAYSYLFYYRAAASPVGTAWTILPIATLGGTNEITDIVDTTSSIEFGAGGGIGSYVFAAGVNGVWLDLTGPGPGTYDFMMVLRQRFVTAIGTQDVPRSNPPDVAFPAGNEVVETILGGTRYSHGLHAVIMPSWIVVA